MEDARSFSLSTRVLSLISALTLSLAVSAHSQTSTGRVVGFVTDQQGAALVGAKVTVTNAGTNIQSATETDSTGAYQVVDVPVGNYFVTVEMSGFGKAVTNTQPLDINQSLRIDVHMKVGAAMERVEVQSQVAQVETLNPTIGATVSGAPVESLPLNGRDVLDLALTQPGVAPAPREATEGATSPSPVAAPMPSAMCSTVARTTLSLATASSSTRILTRSRNSAFLATTTPLNTAATAVAL